MVSALATSLPVMLAGRVIQGAGGAVFPLAFALVRDVVPEPRWAGAVAAVNASLTVTGSLGTVLAGVVLQVLDHHWLFWLPAGLTLLAAAGTRWAIPRPPVQRRAPRPVGWASAALLSTWLTLVLLGVTLLAQPGSRLLAVALPVAAVPVAAWWVRRERAAADPLVDVRTLWTPSVRATNAATVLLGAGMFGAWMLVPMLVLQDPATGVGLGRPPLAVGLFMLVNAAGTVAVTPLVAVLARRAGARAPIVVGGALAAAAYAGLGLWHADAVQVCAGLLVEGCGIGLAFAGIASAVVDSVPADRTGVAAGINTICRTVGGAVGTAACGALLAASAATSGTGRPAAGAYRLAFAGFAIALALSAVAARRAPGPRSGGDPRPRRHGDVPQPLDQGTRERGRLLPGLVEVGVEDGHLRPGRLRRRRQDGEDRGEVVEARPTGSR